MQGSEEKSPLCEGKGIPAAPGGRMSFSSETTKEKGGITWDSKGKTQSPEEGESLTPVLRKGTPEGEDLEKL